MRLIPALYRSAASDARSEIPRISTGWPDVDRLLRGGLHPGHLVLLLGRTGVGKTALAIQMAVSAAQQGRGVLYSTLEMSGEEVFARAVSAWGDRPIDSVQKALCEDPPPPTFAEGLRQLRLLAVDEESGPGWSHYSECLAQYQATAGQAAEVLVVDHFQLMGRGGYPRNAVERVTALADDAKAFARDNNVTVVALHQVGRGGTYDPRTKRFKENTGSSPLSLSSGMYGGEHAADIVLGVYRVDLDPGLSAAQRKAERGRMVLQVLKNRHGPDMIDGVNLLWNLPGFRIEQMEEKKDDYFEDEE